MNTQIRPVVIWLYVGAVMVFFMTAVGGITRLTESGLSMVDWNLFMGAIPPMSEQEWLDTFEMYKQYPEYQLSHSHFSLSDFKSIFFWEYFHRLIGRVIGLVFIIPFVIFLIQKRINRDLLKKLLFLLGVGAFQGFLGWYMVSSGLVKEPRVSHFRLAAHLCTAFFTISYSVWLASKLSIAKNRELIFPKGLYRLTWVTLLVLGIQIIYGAFVAGKDAGLIHNFWPHMNPGEFIASTTFSWSPFLDNFINNPSGIQFVHRYIAYIVTALVVVLFVKSKKYATDPQTQQYYMWMMIITLVQVTLGIVTLMTHVPVWLGVAHQLGALLLLLCTIKVLAWYKPN